MDADVTIVIVNRAWLIAQYVQAITARDQLTEQIASDREQASFRQGQLSILRAVWKLDSNLDTLHEVACSQSRELYSPLLYQAK